MSEVAIGLLVGSAVTIVVAVVIHLLASKQQRKDQARLHEHIEKTLDRIDKVLYGLDERGLIDLTAPSPGKRPGIVKQAEAHLDL